MFTCRQESVKAAASVIRQRQLPINVHITLEHLSKFCLSTGFVQRSNPQRRVFDVMAITRMQTQLILNLCRVIKFLRAMNKLLEFSVKRHRLGGCIERHC